MISGRDILYISSIDWTFQWQGPQEIAVRLGAAGNRVLYVENTGVRAPRLSEAGRVARRLDGWVRSRLAGGLRAVATNVHVCSPLVLPPLGSPWQRAINARIAGAQIGAAARSLGFAPSVIWTYLPTDTVLDLTARFDGPKVALVYYCVADFSQLSSWPERADACERALARRSDVLLASCAALADRFAGTARNVHLFPFGVDLETFRADRPAQPPTEAMARVAGLPRPVVGYVGALERAVDLALLVAMARARPDWSWVFIGAVMRDLGALAALPNVHLLGQRPHHELPRHIQQFDVAIVPYAHNRFTETVVPTKINEYLAMGKAVVSTDLPSVRAFEERHRVLATVPPEAGAFIAAIEASLATSADPAAMRHRRAVASEGDWSARLEAMSALIEPTLDRR